MPDRIGPSRIEFIALVAMLMATVAFSIDSMLPALPDIAGALSPGAPNRAQLIITSFVMGMGAGTLLTGPLSDAFGRRPVVLAGAALYCVGALIAWRAQSLDVMLAARVLQGLGAAGPRVVALALVRDVYSGRDMARIMSFVMIVFMLVPAIAPSLGAILIALFGWRQIFIAFLVFSALSCLWLMLRQPETLPRDKRRPFRPRLLRQAARDVIANRTVRLSILSQILISGMMFGTLSQIQQLFGTTYGHQDSFPLWFAGIAVFAATGSLLNARLVMKFGMRRLARSILLIQMSVSALMIIVLMLHLPRHVEFVLFLPWVGMMFFQLTLTIGNLNALAMEPMGHVAGMAAALIASISTVCATLIAAPLGLAYDGTPMPLAIAGMVMAALAAEIVRRIPRDDY